jgi:hypothetical protein
MDERIEELYKAVLSDEGKPLGEMRQEVRRHIVEAEKIVKETTEPHLETLTTNGLSNASGIPLERTWCA